MFGGNLKMAIATLRASKWRSLLTMFGIIVGVVSVVTTVSLGEGVKRQVLGQINRLGSDLITVRPGNLVTRDDKGTITSVNAIGTYGFGTGSLNDQDIATVQQTKYIKQSSPIGLLNSGLKSGDASYGEGFVLGVNQHMPDLLQQKVEFGSFYQDSDQNKQIAVIGKRVAEKLFNENVPIGQSFEIRGQEYVVRGVFEEFNGSTLSTGVDLNKAVFVPFDGIKEQVGNSLQVVQIIARPEKSSQTNDVIRELNQSFTTTHNGQQDVTILRQDENLTVTNTLLNILTSFIAGIAAISLLVGGIGIMNIMLVSISERTHEIGIRKAVGATNRQISRQFLLEAAVLSFVGGVLGVLLALLTNFIIRISTNLRPVVAWQVVLLAVAVAWLVGIVFGIIPAIQAARKDPIDALRYE